MSSNPNAHSHCIGKMESEPPLKQCGGTRRQQSSGEEDVERAVLGGRAHGAGLGGRVAPAAQAQVPAWQQQHARVRRAARSARRPRRPGGRLCRTLLLLLLELEAARLRVLGVALGSLGAW